VPGTNLNRAVLQNCPRHLFNSPLFGLISCLCSSSFLFIIFIFSHHRPHKTAHKDKTTDNKITGFLPLSLFRLLTKLYHPL
jgi:hypothetical protein